MFLQLGCKTPSRGWYVDIPHDQIFDDNDQKCCQRKRNGICRIWTRKFEKAKIQKDVTHQNGNIRNVESDKESGSLVMVHGLGAGGALFALNFDGLAKHFTVYCLDLPGISYTCIPSCF